MDDAADPLLEGEAALALPAAPYPGLRPFEKHEWSIFFGRETMTQDVVTRLVEKHLVAIHGDSGCGKSSLVRAGVLPILEMDHARVGGSWKTVVMRPEDSPVRNLAQALSSGGGASVDEFRNIVTHAENAALPLARTLGCSAEQNVCIMLDQFEELFEHARRNDMVEAEIITAFLTGLMREKPVGLHAIITMRSDYLGQCANYRGFAETVNETQYLVPRMERPALWRAIREPAALYGGAVEPALVDRLIADAGTGQDQLPLIQHGLMLMWRNKTDGDPAREGWTLDVADYGGERGLMRLLSAHADQVLAAAAPHEDVRIAELAFRALTENNVDKQAIRRPQKFSALCAVTGAAPDRLQRILLPFRKADASFLRPYGEAPLVADSRVDISHEAFIRNWDRIANPDSGWLAKEADDGQRWTTLKLSAEAYGENNDDLLSPATAEEAKKLVSRVNPAWAERYGGDWGIVEQLIGASQKAARRAANRSRWLLGAAVAVAFAMTGLAWYAMEQTAFAEKAQAEAEWALGEAKRQEAAAKAWARQAERDAERALRNETISLAALARVAANEGRSTEAVKLALAAWPRKDDPDRPMLKDVVDVAQSSTAALAELSVIDGVLSTKAVQSSPDRKLIAAGTADGSIHLWDVEKKLWLDPLVGHNKPIASIAFSPDSARIASVTVDRAVRIWDLATRTDQGFAISKSSPLSDVTLDFDGTGRWLFAVDADNNAVLALDLDRPGTSTTIKAATAVAGDITRDGGTIALASVANDISIWNVATKQKIREERLAARDHDPGQGKPPGPDHRPWVVQIEYSQDGSLIAVASNDGSAAVLDGDSLEPILTVPSLGGLNSASISPGNEWIATCGNAIVIWEIRTGKMVASKHHPAGRRCRYAEWASDGKSIIAAYDAPAIWDASWIGIGTFAAACERLGKDTDLAEIKRQYGLSTLSPICGDNPPLPVDPAKLQ